MNASNEQKHITVGEFSAAFERMCNFVAVAKTGDPQATVLGLVQLCFTVLPDEQISSAAHLAEIIEQLFMVKLPIVDAERALDQLYNTQTLLRDPSNRYSLTATVRANIQMRIDEATTLERRIKATWQSEISASFPSMDPEKAWASLKGYLFRAFRRHGIQSVALLDPAFPINPSHETSLASLLKDAVSEQFAVAERPIAERAVAGFLAELGHDADRAKYIAQLADAAFSFYSLEVDPEISAKLRSRLQELTLFLDTNFLFGILELHNDSQTDVSHDLLRAIAVHKLPFKLRFHEATNDEVRRTITFFSRILQSRQWSRSLSRAAAQTRQLSGIEQRFHERNSEHLIDVDEFLRPIQHFDAVIAENNIKIYRPTGNRLKERVELYHEYKEFLEQNGRPDKLYETIQHDATILDATRLLRTKAKSSLDAGALLVTCDYLLYKFDRDTSRRTGRHPCVVLPNILWQLLRPFIQMDADFERSFAETFALPEFRALCSGGAKACSRMISILATYKDIPEQTAFRLLTDGMLIGRLRDITSDEQFEKVVESAIVEENRTLLEESTALKQSLAERAAKEKEHAEMQKRREQEFQDAKKAADEKLEAKETRIGALESKLTEIDESKIRSNALKKYISCLAVITLVSVVIAWFIWRIFPMKGIFTRAMLTSTFAIVSFIIGHLGLERLINSNTRITQLWLFIHMRHFRKWLWSIAFLSFVLGVIGNLVANRIQTENEITAPIPDRVNEQRSGSAPTISSIP
ncbi:MAG: hypothetical protein WCS85_02250 [Candidatus Peribacteraceae bacterium]|jgi:hypothetical protein